MCSIFSSLFIIRADMADGNDGQQPHNSWKFNLLFSIWLPHQQRLRIFECSLIEKDERVFMKKELLKLIKLKFSFSTLYFNYFINERTRGNEIFKMRMLLMCPMRVIAVIVHIYEGGKYGVNSKIHFWCSIYKSSRQCDDDCLFEQRISSRNLDDNKVLRYTLSCGNDDWKL